MFQGLGWWLWVGCGARSPAPVPEASAPPVVRSLRFEDVGPDAGPATRVAPLASPRAVLDGREIPIGYRVLARSGEPGFGEIRSADGTRAIDTCHDQDFDSLLWAFDRPFLVSHFECAPGDVVISPLDQDAEGGLTRAGAVSADFDDLGGVWLPCAGQVSPWGTHLGSEEYEPDARAWKPDGTLSPDPYDTWRDQVRRYDDPRAANPYHYGWTPEIRVTSADGASEAVKRLAPGRFSHEVAFVLPDGRTTYLSDDGTAVGFFLFVADRAGDLSAGALYAARFTPGAATGEATVGWVPLGHATDAQVRAWIDADVRFGDLFEVGEPTGAGDCPEGFRWTRHHYGTECLKLAPPSAKVPDPALAASRLETRRYAAWLGATTELEKGEGVTWDPESRRVFLAVSAIAGRLAEGGDAGAPAGADHLALPPNPCGMVWAGSTAGGVADTEGRPIDSGAVVVAMAPELAGTPLDPPDAAGNRCAPDGIANPDNLTLLPGYGLLMVAEDTRRHAHAALWAHDLRTRERVRVLVAPTGGEITGIHWIPDLGGFGYLTAVVQHPWGELGKDAVIPPEITEDDKRAFTGVIGPFPSLKIE